MHPKPTRLLLGIRLLCIRLLCIRLLCIQKCIRLLLGIPYAHNWENSPFNYKNRRKPFASFFPKTVFAPLCPSSSCFDFSLMLITAFITLCCSFSIFCRPPTSACIEVCLEETFNIWRIHELIIPSEFQIGNSNWNNDHVLNLNIIKTMASVGSSPLPLTERGCKLNRWAEFMVTPRDFGGTRESQLFLGIGRIQGLA